MDVIYVIHVLLMVEIKRLWVMLKIMKPKCDKMVMKHEK